MSKMTQKQAVYTAILSVLSQSSVHFEEGTDVAPFMTRERRGQVNNILFEGFRTGSIELEKEYSDADLKAYVSGLQSNWIRKDKRLNGGTQYQVKNPGSRVTDPSIKAMRALLSSGKVTNAADVSEIETLIASRQAELAASKKTVEVNYEALPAALRAKFSS